MSDSKDAARPNEADARGHASAAQPSHSNPRRDARPDRRKPLGPEELAEIELIRGDTTVTKVPHTEEPVEPAADSSSIELPVPDYHKTPGTMTKRG